MSKIQVPALYQTETFSSGFQRRSPRQETPEPVLEATSKRVSGQAPQRQADFLVQLISSNDPDLRKVLGRHEVARAREAAYAFAFAHRRKLDAKRPGPGKQA
ncbi:hypothetical protein MCEMSEM23_01365 [Rhabdaerophilaceae bacterium]